MFLVVGLIALFMAGSLGLPHFGMTAEMHGEGHMTTNDCVMPGMTAVCAINPLEHIASWQVMFTAAFTQEIEFLLFLLLLASVRFVVQLIHIPQDNRLSQLFRRREYVPLCSPLQELYARGILNPKVY